MEGIRCCDFVFFNKFDSGNLAKVEYVKQSDPAAVSVANLKQASNRISAETADIEFNVWTKPDCCGTEFENGNRTWFYFGIKAPLPSVLVKLNLVDLNRQGKMYSQGMAPVYRIAPEKPKWERIHDKPVYSLIDNIFTLSFKFRTPENRDSYLYLAFTYPFTYVELEKMLVNIDAKYLNIKAICDDDIYYVHETVCRSLEGRSVSLLTISSYHGITSEREDRLKHLFPDGSVPRPHKFVKKKVIFISARVHPGETPSSFVFNGLLQLLLNRDDLTAQTLRKMYVFKLIPFLNPDGVARGHYRTDTRGVNLNRVYLDPSLSEHPSIYAARALIRYYHFGVEKEDSIPKCDNCKMGHPINDSGTEDEEINQNATVSRMTNMRLAEEKSTPWCSKCKANVLKYEDTMPGISSIIPTFTLSHSLGHNFCRSCGATLTHTESKEEIAVEAVGAHGDVNSNDSGLFLYVDLHGHASKKGVFMYGNHFDDLERRVECMLLPKLMSLNNHHFHFQSCNFTERNMYLRDKSDGMSRAGSGRVAVLSITGIIKSYTLECNYNTGRLVNVLPASIKEPNGKVHTLPVPPKFTPQIFEEVGKSLGSSILDLTGQNPYTRLPNSEFHSLSGLKEWLRINCSTNDFGFQRPKMTKMRSTSPNLQNQGKTRGVVVKSRPPVVKNVLKTQGKCRPATGPTNRKENLLCRTATNQPSCSKSSLRLNSVFKAKTRHDLKNKIVASNSEKTPRTAIARNKKTINITSQSVKSDKSDKESTSGDSVKLKEICYIKGGEGGKTMIAKYKNKNDETFEDNLIVSWDTPSSQPTVFTHKAPRVSPTATFLRNKSVSEPGTSKQHKTSVFRIHNFVKTSFSKTRLKKHALRRLSSATEPLSKQDKKKKKLKLKAK